MPYAWLHYQDGSIGVDNHNFIKDKHPQILQRSPGYATDWHAKSKDIYNMPNFCCMKMGCRSIQKLHICIFAMAVHKVRRMVWNGLTCEELVVCDSTTLRWDLHHDSSSVSLTYTLHIIVAASPVDSRPCGPVEDWCWSYGPTRIRSRVGVACRAGGYQPHSVPSASRRVQLSALNSIEL